MRVFGYRHLKSFFRKVFIIDEQGELFHKGALIPWNRIVAYKRRDDFIGRASRRPHTRFYLDDGSGFTVLAWLMEQGKPARPQFQIVAKPTEAYQEFVQLVRERSRAQNLQDTRAGRYGGLWLVIGIGGQALGTLLYATGLNLGMPLPLYLLLVGAPSVLGGLIAQRMLERRCIREIRAARQ